jgi:polar amino acid transport system permease protein/polar amino acid transport system substrate-binding protein
VLALEIVALAVEGLRTAVGQRASPVAAFGPPMTRLRVLAGALLIAFSPCAAPPLAHAAADTLEHVRARGALRWGADVQGGEPYAFQDPQNADRVIGFEVEMADAIALRLGVRAELVQNDWHHLIPALERGDFEMVLNGLEVTPQRRDRVLFTRPYFAFRETLVVRQDDHTVHSLDDLRGERVGTLTGSLAAEILAQAPAIETVLYEGVEEPYIDLEQRRIRAVVHDHIIANRYGLVRPGLRSAGSVGQGVYAIAVRRGDTALLGAVDGALAEMMGDGELRAILTRWNLWDDRQATLADTATATSAAPAAAAERSGLWALTPAQLLLFLRATWVTAVISTLAMALAVAGGLTLSLARRYGGRLAHGLTTAYIELFRGTPLLLQIYVLYYGLAPILTLDAFTAAVVGLGMNYAAYEAELYRAGMEAVPLGQTEAALALGMSRGLALRRIVLPQALRVALPGVANDFIALLKDSSLVSVITVVELTKQMTITAVDVRGWLGPGLLCAALYLCLSYPLSRMARRLERRLAPVPA